ncbi:MULTISPECIES: hypothetical protein [Xanthomonas]|uniref:Uncharacterized protein n=2 Tax=Xanthomonas TaxID=338 RepID=A0A7Z7IYI4_XANCH|nr:MULTISPECIES: hypothetical protein [Xanthomonas]ATS39254.1 hypothetical protein XcfCFBP6988P_14925 [Xanthomonas citri pv. phaseoli var. fuscans]ATS41939.1 hypothetical protein XcfCFBP6989P_05565 [Xanthomonas citri pv. phaseoli var. fuscans]ATS47257.1 hypothetical protein XcfCFBP6990P_11795 [Xanthomonas citri pv. phaseoli var. fuscans]ATS86364.1 hypothetical protein XcfCFBP6991P_22435 [Xanthomonas citri pv. phaseoli var. fuscans]QWN20899.1 hypothetical protein DGM98_12860 [Xanthomonas citri]
MVQLAIDAQNTVWASAPGTDEGATLGKGSSEKVGFYGATPIAQPTITAANSAAGTAGAVLVALGLARQIP